MLGRSDIPFAEMITLDYLYVTNWSLWGDIKLLARTVPPSQRAAARTEAARCAARDRRRAGAELLLVCSTGGHLLQLVAARGLGGLLAGRG